jgi:flagellin-specific chaperone FliS
MNTALYRAANTYANVDLETSVQGANPHRLILMLFEAAILSVNKAQRYMEVENIAMKGMTISKAGTSPNNSRIFMGICLAVCCWQACAMNRPA